MVVAWTDVSDLGAVVGRRSMDVMGVVAAEVGRGWGVKTLEAVADVFGRTRLAVQGICASLGIQLAGEE